MGKDIFGLSIYKYWKGNRRISIKFIRDDSKKFTLSPKLFFSKHKGFWNSEKSLLKHIKSKVLDVGCGVGRHVLYLQNKEYKVSGMDYSKYLIEICKKRGCKNCHQGDIYNYKSKKKYETLILFGNNLGIAQTPKKARRFFRALKNLTNKGGKILITSIDYDKTTDKDFKNYIKWNKKKGKFSGQLVSKNIIDAQETEWVNWLYMTPNDVEKVCDDVGLHLEEVYREKNGRYGAVIGRSFD